jgi:hypothetical protein
MHPLHDAAIRMYDGALRALDTKAQIFLGFMTLTMGSVFARLEDMGTPRTVRVAEVLLFLSAVACFVYCLYPRRGKRASRGLFDTNLSGDEIVRMLDEAGDEHDLSSSVATLHDIYRIKARSVALGITLVGVYVLTVALTFAVS